MNDTTDLVSTQIDLIKQAIELAELQAHGTPYSSHNLPPESVHKRRYPTRGTRWGTVPSRSRPRAFDFGGECWFC